MVRAARADRPWPVERNTQLCQSGPHLVPAVAPGHISGEARAAMIASTCGGGSVRGCRKDRPDNNLKRVTRLGQHPQSHTRIDFYPCFFGCSPYRPPSGSIFPCDGRSTSAARQELPRSERGSRRGRVRPAKVSYKDPARLNMRGGVLLIALPSTKIPAGKARANRDHRLRRPRLSCWTGSLSGADARGGQQQSHQLCRPVWWKRRRPSRGTFAS